MKPTLSSLKKLVLKNCNRKNCEKFEFNERKLTSDNRCKHNDYRNRILCNILNIKFTEWNSLFFPNRPCDECLVKAACINNARYISSKIATCDLFVKYRDNLLSRHKKGNTQVLMPELKLYSAEIVEFLNRHWFR